MSFASYIDARALALVLCATGITAANAEETAEAVSNAAPAVQLDGITVTGSRVPTALSDLPTSVSQISEPELAEQLTTTTNILETLDVLVPGLTVSQEEFRSGCRTNIRGRPAQFLINGVPTNDNLRASTCGSLFNLSPFAIERVEVVRGATALFGAGAPGGVINLITRRARSQQAEIDVVAQWGFNPHAMGGSSEQNLYAGVGRAFAGSDYYLGYGLQDYGVRRNPDDGIVPGETFRSSSLNASAGWALGGGELRFTGLYYVRDPHDAYGTDFTQVSGSRLAGSAFIVQPPNPYAEQAQTKQTVLTLSYDLPSIAGHTLNVSTYWHDEELIQRAADFFEGEVFYFDSDAENQRLGLRTTLSRDFAIGADALGLVYGLDLLRQRYYRPQVDPQSGAVIGYVSPEVILDSAALFVQPQYRRGAWLITGGVRHERFQGEVGPEGFDPGVPRAATPGETPDFDLTLFNLGVVWDVSARLQLYGGFSQGAEISEFGRAARGAADPSLINLDAAASDQYEIGLRGRRGAVDFSVAAFYSQSDKAASLQADPSCADEPVCPLIPLRLEQEFYGLEGTFDWQMSATTLLGGVLTYQQGERQPPGGAKVAVATDTISPPRATVYVEADFFADWHNRLQATYMAETDEYNETEEASGLRDSESVFLVDVSSSYPVGPGTLTLGVANLFNERYVNATNSASGDFFYYLSEGTRTTLSYELRF
jgi:iron complex outermembrane recepter protein